MRRDGALARRHGSPWAVRGAGTTGCGRGRAGSPCQLEAAVRVHVRGDATDRGSEGASTDGAGVRRGCGLARRCRRPTARLRRSRSRPLSLHRHQPVNHLGIQCRVRRGCVSQFLVGKEFCQPGLRKIRVACQCGAHGRVRVAAEPLHGCRRVWRRGRPGRGPPGPRGRRRRPGRS